MKVSGNLIVAIALLCWAGSSQGGVLGLFTDRTAWEAAVSGTVTTVDFESPDASASGFLNVSPSLTTPEGVNFQSPPDSLLFIINPVLDPLLPSQFLASEQNASGIQSLDIGLPSSSAFGLDMISLTETASVNFILPNGDTVSSIISPDSVVFFGALFDTDFISIQVSAALSSADSLRMDNFSFVSANPVPVPAAFWLFGTALVAFTGLGRRKNRNK